MMRKKILLSLLCAVLFAGHLFTWRGDGAAGAQGDVDVDLSLLSSTMTYAEVFNMRTEPDAYVCKTVRLCGRFTANSNKDKTRYYPSVVVTDATACCAQGMEFVLEGEPTYPDGYPQPDSDIVVVGTFETYEDMGMTFCRLARASIE